MQWIWGTWEIYRAHPHREEITPVLAPLASLIGSILTLAVGGFVAWAALKQAKTATEQARTAARQAEVARQQAEVARLRHEEQTKADFQRRTTESFAKAVEQLGSEKEMVRLGGIYTLERTSRESEADYWTVMEILTAFVRDHARREGGEDDVAPSGDANDQQRPVHKPAADVAAVLTVILRRGETSRKREQQNGWRLDLSRSDLRGAHLGGAHLEGAIFREARFEDAVFRQARLEGAHFEGARLEGAFLLQARLEGASLVKARLERANLAGACLEGASLVDARLGGASLMDAHLGGADLGGARLEGAGLLGASFEGAYLGTAHLEGTDLRGAIGLTRDQIQSAFGNSTTVLPEGFSQPAHWSERQH